MLQSESTRRENKSVSRMIPVVPEEGLFASMMINADPEVVFTICQEEMSLEKVLEGLPYKADQILELSLVEAERRDNQYVIRFKNKAGSKLEGELKLFIGEAYNGRGALLCAEAGLDLWTPKGDSPSTMMNAFLKRLKSLVETGEIATTKGQPSGREEKKTLH